MKYGVVGFPMVNDVIFEDGRRRVADLGGGTFFNYSGIRFCTDDCIFIAATGRDFEEHFGKWFDDNRCSRDGLILRTDKCVYFIVEYIGDGKYKQSSLYGSLYNNITFAEQFIPAEQLEKYIADGIDVLMINGKRGTDELYCSTLRSYKEKYGLKIGWEFPGWEYLSGKGDETCARILSVCDYYSLNKHEAFMYYGVSTEEEAIDAIIKEGIPCYFRVGVKGAYMIRDGRAVFHGLVRIGGEEDDVDATGCGNVSTAAAAWAFFEGWSDLEICIWGNICAGYNALQYGPIPNICEEKRPEAKRLLARLVSEYQG